MKRITAILLMALMTLFMFTGCKREGEMIETMVSSIFSTDSQRETENNTASSGQVTDSDGHIGNENSTNTTVPDTTTGGTDTTRSSGNSIM